VSEAGAKLADRGTLAVLGGAPAFVDPLHVGRPNIGDRGRFEARLAEILDRRWFTNAGPVVQEFERRLADFLGVRNCIAICNGTVALELAIRALELKGEVIVPSATFVATAHALQWQKITPVFCDIDPRTHNLDPKAVAERITPRTTGIVGVHLWGRPCDIDALADLAHERHLELLFDAAHAFGCTHGGRKIGGFGRAEVFSFHATKVFHTFEGGAIATDDDALADKLRLMKNFGFRGYDNVVSIGTNGKMPEVCAAMGLSNLDDLGGFIDTNRRNYAAYGRALANVPGVTPITHDERERCNYQYVIFEIDEGAAGISRDEVVRALHAENVLARRYFFPGCHRMKPYIDLYPDAGRGLPHTERVLSRVISLPNGTAVDEKSVALVAKLIRQIVDEAPAVRRALCDAESRA
jgi:dTDP-4-amino-4,6-dideoxygalactose transaminase